MSARFNPTSTFSHLYLGVEDAWQQLSPSCPGAILVVPGRFTSRTTPERMGARLFVGQPQARSLATAVEDLAALSSQQG